MVFQKISFFSARLLALLCLLLWMGIIFSFSSLSGVATEGPPPLWYFIERKGAHIVEYAVLMFLSFRFFRLSFGKEKLLSLLLLSAGLALSYAVTDELHQFFVPFRGARFSDVLIDGGGILLSSLSIFFFQQSKNRP